MEFTYYGQSCFLVKIAGKNVLFDPFISPNDLAKHIDVDAIKADYIFISHGHSDHIADAVSIAQHTNAICVASFEVASHLAGAGVEQTEGMNPGGFITFDFGLVKGTSAVHSSSFEDGSYAGNPIGFLFKTGGGNFYYSGDTALCVDMQLIPLWANLDFAVLPIGGHFTMDVEDAIHASNFINCDTVVGVHYDTFPPIKINKAEAITRFKAAGKNLLLPAIGETIHISTNKI